jgi:transposase
MDLIVEIRHLDRRITKAAADIETALSASGSTLTELCGIGTLTAAKVLAWVGLVQRFRSAAAFASYNGTAPLETSSGDVIRHRLSRAGAASSTAAYTPWRSPRSRATPPGGRTT